MSPNGNQVGIFQGKVLPINSTVKLKDAEVGLLPLGFLCLSFSVGEEVKVSRGQGSEGIDVLPFCACQVEAR